MKNESLTYQGPLFVPDVGGCCAWGLFTIFPVLLQESLGKPLSYFSAQSSNQVYQAGWKGEAKQATLKWLVLPLVCQLH